MLPHLKTLHLPVFKIPSLNDTRKAYKSLLLDNHPDKNENSSEATARFQEITEAVRYVMEYISKHEGSSDKCEKEEDAQLIRILEKNGDLSFKSDSVLITIPEKDGEVWLKSLAAKLGGKTRMEDGVGWQMRLEEWSIPNLSCKTNKTYGSISICIWIKPKNGSPK